MYYNNVLDKKKVGKFLKSCIIDKYGTIAEYSRQTDQVYQTVHSWTSGSRLPELEDMVANCNILNIPLEYVLVGTNLNNQSINSEDINYTDEFRERAVWKYPNLIFSDIAMIMPLIDIRKFIDIVNRVIDCNNNSFYVYSLFRSFICMNSDAWKYCVYVLQSKNSPLVMDLEKIEANNEALHKWAKSYQEKKEKYVHNIEKLYNTLYQLHDLTI